MTSRARKQAEGRGRRAELWAELLLRLKGYRILERRYKTPLGEIDLIARTKNTLVIVEVKQRPTLEAAHASLYPSSLKRIENAASLYQGHHEALHNLGMRFDLVFVLPKFRIIHLKDAWRTY